MKLDTLVNSIHSSKTKLKDSIRTIHLVLFSFFITCNLFWQINYIEYHKVIAKAEDSIITKNYVAAFNLYDSIFQAYPKPFSKDLHNAALCANYLKDVESAKKYLMKLSDLGIDKKAIKKGCFINLRFQKGWLDFKKQYSKSVQKANYDKRQNNKFTFLDSLRSNSINIQNDSLKNEQLIQLIFKNGYPNEREFFPTKPGILTLSMNFLEQMFQSNQLLKENFLFEQIKLGNLHPYLYASLKDTDNKVSKKQQIYGSMVYTKLKKYVFFHEKYFYINKEHRVQYDKNREALGLDNYNSYVTKVLDRKRHLKPFVFMTYSGVNNLKKSTREKGHFMIKTKKGMIVFF